MDKKRNGFTKSSNPELEPKRWEGNREKLFERLGNKVDLVLMLKRKIDYFRDGTPLVEIKDDLKEYVETARARFSAKVLEGVDRYKELEKRIKELDKLLDSEEYRADSDEEDMQIYKEAHNLGVNPDIRFLLILESTVESLLKKAERVSLLKKEGKKKMLRELEAILRSRHGNEGLELDPRGIRKIIPTVFSINFILGPRYFLDICGNVHGLHFCNTPVNIISDRGDTDTAKTLRHEELHNLTDEVFQGYSVSYILSRLKNLLNNYTQLLEIRAPQAIIGNYLDVIKSKVRPKEIIDQLHNEILATFLSRERLGAPQPKEAYDIFTLLHPFSAEEQPHAIPIIDFLDTQSRNHPREEVRSLMKEAVEKIKLKMKDLISIMRHSIDITQGISPEAESVVHALFLILSPSQYGHIKGFLEYRYGLQRIKDYEEIVEAIRGLSGISISEHIQGLRKLINMFEKLSPIHIKWIKEFTEPIKDGVLPEAAYIIDSLEEMERYQELLGQIFQKLGVEIDRDMLHDFLLRAFCFNLFYKNVELQFKNIVEIYQRLDEGDKEIFRSVLYEDVENGLLFQALPKGSRHNLEEIKKLPLWREICRLGMEDEIAEAINRAINEFPRE